MKLKTIVRWKIYFDRARIYVSYVQFLMLVLILVKLIKNNEIKQLILDYWFISFPLFFILFVVGCLLIGFLDSRLKIREEEQKNYSETNPVQMEIKKNTEKILKRLNV